MNKKTIDTTIEWSRIMKKYVKQRITLYKYKDNQVVGSKECLQ